MGPHGVTLCTYAPRLFGMSLGYWVLTHRHWWNGMWKRAKVLYKAPLCSVCWIYIKTSHQTISSRSKLRTFCRSLSLRFLGNSVAWMVFPNAPSNNWTPHMICSRKNRLNFFLLRSLHKAAIPPPKKHPEPIWVLACCLQSSHVGAAADKHPVVRRKAFAKRKARLGGEGTGQTGQTFYSTLLGPPNMT